MVKWELQKTGKEMALGFIDRLLVVERDRVPLRARELLLAAYYARKSKK